MGNRKMIRKEDKILEGQILDKLQQCESCDMYTYTQFLDLHQQSVAQKILQQEMKGRNLKAFFYGGYEKAMRRCLFFLPAYMEDRWKEVVADVITILEVSLKKKEQEVSHRDYLGAFIGAGMKRELIGDIVVQEQGAQILVLEEVSHVVLEEYSSVGRNQTACVLRSLAELNVHEEEREIQRGTLTSIRLDAMLALSYQVSRTKAQEWIQKGIVFVNYVEKYKNEFPFQEGDIIVVRGWGKIEIKSFGVKNKKNKIPVYYIKY